MQAADQHEDEDENAELQRLDREIAILFDHHATKELRTLLLRDDFAYSVQDLHNAYHREYREANLEKRQAYSKEWMRRYRANKKAIRQKGGDATWE